MGLKECSHKGDGMEWESGRGTLGKNRVERVGHKEWEMSSTIGL